MRHTSNSLNNAIILITVLFMITAMFLPDLHSTIAPWILLISVFVIGIPHGAIDHIMAAELFGLKQKVSDHLIFYSSYLLIMFFVALLWFFLPIAGMALFLIISIYHFGQADMEDFMIPNPGNWIWHIGRGLLIIGLIIFVNPEVTYPIMADAMQINEVTFANWLPDPVITSGLLVIGYFLLSLIGYFQSRFHNIGAYVYDSLILSGLLIITGPLIGFAVYFALWHSAGHINEMKSYFSGKGKTLTTFGFYKKALPFTLISILGLILLVALNSFLNLQNQFLTLMFILISVLTLPHMFIVDKMYTENKG